MALIVRIVDEMRYGFRSADLGDIDTLASIWSTLNEGMAPTEHVINALAKLEPPTTR
jgi:hypothetical protein